MKLMIDGRWRGDVDEPPPDLAAERAIHAGRFRDALPAGPLEPGRLHLFVSYACPFAHRVILGRTLLGLEDWVGMSVLDPVWNTPHGWIFGGPLGTPDGSGEGFTHLHQAYAATSACYTGKVTVPALWDRRERRILSNQSADILTLLNHAASGAGGPLDLEPPDLAEDVAALSATVRQDLAAGVYAVGGARDQAEYDRASDRVFGCLAALESRLADGRPWLHGDRLTVSDVLAFTPLARFDAIYNPLFRASRRRLVDHPRLAAFAARFADLPGVGATIRMDHILRHYHDGDWGVATRRGIVPDAPEVDFRSAPA